MARVQIHFPEKQPVAVVSIPVRITDINYGDHLGNDSIVSIIHEARVQFLKQHHIAELEPGGTSLIMSDLAISFKNESFYGDVLTIEIFSADISKVSFDLLYKISTTRNEKPLVVANAKTTMVCFNYSTKKVVSVPANFREILE